MQIFLSVTQVNPWRRGAPNYDAIMGNGSIYFILIAKSLPLRKGNTIKIPLSTRELKDIYCNDWRDSNWFEILVSFFYGFLY